MSNGKRRRTFKVYRNTVNDYGDHSVDIIHEVANGVLYDEGNVQVLWRVDVGFTAEQYANIGSVFGIVEGANTIKIRSDDDKDN